MLYLKYFVVLYHGGISNSINPNFLVFIFSIIQWKPCLPFSSRQNSTNLSPVAFAELKNNPVMSVSTMDGTADLADVTTLLQRMLQMPRAMNALSRGLRSLYAEQAVSGSASAASFRQIRDAVRRDATVYVTMVLPLANSVVINISAYFDNYLSLTYEDWVESLEDIIEEVEGYEKACILLTQMHESLMTSLKKREDEAQLSIVEMERLSSQLRSNVGLLHAAAARHAESADTWEMWGDGLMIATLGLSSLFTQGAVESRRAEANRNTAMAVAESANADIARQAACLTGQVLIPAVKNFLEGLSVCQAFFAETRANLIKMNSRAKIAVDKKDSSSNIKRQFNIMKSNAEKIDAACKVFFGCIGEVSLYISPTYFFKLFITL